MTSHLETFANNGLSEPFYWLTRPTAVYHNGKTYVVWHGSGYDPYITYYDHTTKEWDQVRWVADNPMSGNGHGAPSMIVDSNGYIHVFYGATIAGGYPLKHAISNNPENISAFTVKPNIGMYNYPKPINIENTLYLFVMERSDPSYLGNLLSYQIWNGSSWGTHRSIISANVGNSTYVGFMEYRENKVHMTWCFYVSGEGKRKNVYYAYLNMSDMNMYSINGTNLGSTISQSEADAYCMVHNTGSNQSNTASMHFDSNGYPWIIYPEGSGTNWNFYHTRWNGSSWTTPVHITTTDNQFNYEDFKINSITNVTAYLNTSGEPGSGGNIEEWHWDGSAWSKVSTILSELQSGRPLGGPNIPYDDHEVRLVFSQYLDDDFSVSNLKLYAVIEDSIECPSLSASLTITPTTIISGESITYTSKAIGGVPDDNGFGHLGKAREMSGTLQISDISASNHTVTSKITDGCLPTNQTATSPSSNSYNNMSNLNM